MPTPLRLTPEQRKEAAAMYAREFSHRQLAAHFACSAQAIRSALKAEGVPSREKWQARKLRNQFPTKQSPNGPRPSKTTVRPQPTIPAASPRRCGFVFNLAAHV